MKILKLQNSLVEVTFFQANYNVMTSYCMLCHSIDLVAKRPWLLYFTFDFVGNSVSKLPTCHLEWPISMFRYVQYNSCSLIFFGNFIRAHDLTFNFEGNSV